MNQVDKDNLVPVPRVEFFVGMELAICCKNDNVLKGIGNGVTARIVDTVPSLHTMKNGEDYDEITEHPQDGPSYTIRVLRKMPRALLVHNDSFKVTQPGQHPCVVAIQPSKKHTMKLQNLPGTYTLNYFSVRPVFARTCHILQGSTKEAIVLGDATLNDPNWLYTALSRIKSWQGLYIMCRHFILKIIKTKTIHADQNHDTQRLEALSKKTAENITYA